MEAKEWVFFKLQSFFSEGFCAHEEI